MSLKNTETISVVPSTPVVGTLSKKEGMLHLCSQLFLSVHQAFDVCWVIATALARCDGAFKGGGGDLRRHTGGGAEGPTAEAGGQWVAQRLGYAVTKSIPKQQEVARFLHLRIGTSLSKIIKCLEHKSLCLYLTDQQAESRGEKAGVDWVFAILPESSIPRAAAPASPAPTGAPGWGCLHEVASLLGSLLPAHMPQRYPRLFSSASACLI